MRIDRLEQLIRVLEEVESTGREFDMTIWVSRTKCDTPPCHTAACALGWVALSPDVPEVTIRGEAPYFGGRCGMLAGVAWLQCSVNESWWLFDPAAYSDDAREEITVQDVVCRARDLMLSPERRSEQWFEYLRRQRHED